MRERGLQRVRGWERRRENACEREREMFIHMNDPKCFLPLPLSLSLLGRNVALRQVNARQSSTFSNWFARNAVDGDIGPVDGSDTQLRRTCTHTDSYYQDAWWSLTFSTAVHLSEVVIYNRRNPSRTGKSHTQKLAQHCPQLGP